MITTINKLNKYEVLEEITEGMNAYAYKAQHKHLGINVFLKVYDPCNCDDTVALHEPRCLVEVSTEKFSCENIVKIYDVDRLSNGSVLISMELVNGGSLLSAIENKTLGLMDAINISKKILKGLNVLHCCNLLHRDLKPANIVLEQNSMNPKIADFGSVARIKNLNDSVSASRHSALYVPPEGWQGGYYCVSSDIYQVGIILYEMTNGELPYSEEAYLDQEGKKTLKNMGLSSIRELEDFERSIFINACIARLASKSKILTLRQPKPFYPAKLKKIIKDATQPILEKRYSSVTPFLSALSELNFPNWKDSDSGFYAQNWKHFDWKIENVKNKFIAKRAKVGTQNYRQYAQQDDLSRLFVIVTNSN